MNIKALIFLWAPIILIGCHEENSALHKEESNGPTVTVVDQQIQPDPPLENFNLGSKQLPEHFKASNPVQVMDAIASLQVDRQKGQYETKKEFTSRLDALKNTVLFDEVRLGGGFAFSLGRSFHYDADKQTFEFGKSYLLTNHGDNPNLDVYETQLDSSRFAILNKYFAERGYESLIHKQVIKLTLANLKGNIEKLYGKYKVDRVRAKEIAPDLEVIVVGYVVPPYFWTGDRYPDERRNPVVEHQFFINFRFEGMWLVNRATGEILSRQYTIQKF